MAELGDWDKSQPSGSSLVRDGDDLLRSDKSIQQEAWEEEHFFTDGSNSSTGVHKLGSTRPYLQTASSISTSGDDARLHVSSDVSDTWLLGSDFLLPLTEPLGLRMGFKAGSGHSESKATDKVWVAAIVRDTPTGASDEIEFPVVYDGIPFCTGSPRTTITNDDGAPRFSIDSLTTAGVRFSAFTSHGAGLNLYTKFEWQVLSIGTISRSSLS